MRQSQGYLDTSLVTDIITKHKAKMFIVPSNSMSMEPSLSTTSSPPTYRNCLYRSSISSIRFILPLLLVAFFVSLSHTSPFAPKQVIVVNGPANNSKNPFERIITFTNVTSSRKRATFSSRKSNQKETTSGSSSSMSSMAESVISNSFQNCPVSDELIAPCSCNATKREVFCRGIFDPSTSGSTDSGNYLKTAFTNFARLVPPAYKYFHSVYISMRGLKTLKRNVFADIRFNTVVLKSINLTYIDNEAFLGLENYAQSLYLYGTNLSQARPKYDFFQAIKTLSSLQKVIINQHCLGEVPEKLVLHQFVFYIYISIYIFIF